jgi:vacuolar-type H+-ATPase subunit C/Vma6
VIVTARFAYANARLRGMKSRLLGPQDGFALRAAPSLAALAGGLGTAPPADARQVRLELLAALVRDYGKVMASYPRGGPLFGALLGLHEIENLKLAWRAHARGLPAERWTPLWRPLGRLGALQLENWRRAASLREAAALARGTPYEPVVAEALRVHEKDPASAELSFDRFASRRLADRARSLPRKEKAARDLVLSLVRERDADAVRRAIVSGRFAPEHARQAAAVFPEDLPAGAAPPEPGRLTALRRGRRKACRAAFLGPPLRLAPPVAYLLLREEEVRAVTALAEACGAPAPAEAIERAFAASALAG